MADKKTEQSLPASRSKFTLVELLSIVILVGLIFMIVVPVNQTRASREYLMQALNTINMISQKAEAFKDNPENGYYPDISQLNLGKQIDSPYFEYSINADDSTIVAITKPDYGKKGAYLIYSMTAKQFRVGKDSNDLTSSKYINENWLP